jgi:hypothetical protein
MYKKQNPQDAVFEDFAIYGIGAMEKNMTF